MLQAIFLAPFSDLRHVFIWAFLARNNGGNAKIISEHRYHKLCGSLTNCEFAVADIGEAQILNHPYVFDISLDKFITFLFGTFEILHEYSFAWDEPSSYWLITEPSKASSWSGFSDLTPAILEQNFIFVFAYMFTIILGDPNNLQGCLLYIPLGMLQLLDFLGLIFIILLSFFFFFHF